MKQQDPPLLLVRFFTWFCHQMHLEGLEGDLYELFDRNVEKYGVRTARWLWFLDMLTLMRPSVSRSFFKNSKTLKMGIYQNYFRTMLRLSWKRKSFTAINIIGLTLGITSSLFITLFVQDELSYDAHVNNSEKIFRAYNEVYREGEKSGYFPIVPPMFATIIGEEFPQVESVGRIMHDYGGSTFKVGDVHYSEDDGVFAEQVTLDILDMELLHGSYDDLAEPYSMLLSETMFQKYFGEVEFENQVVQLGSRSVKIAGVYRDFPDQSHITPEYVLSWAWLENNVPEERMKSWIWQQFFTYVELKDGQSIEEFKGLFQSRIESVAREQTEEYSYYYIPFFQNIRDIHLHSDGFQWEISETGSYRSVLFLSIAAGIILLIACLNYINLTTAMAVRRAREVGIRKFVGATRGQLFTQYTMESTFFCLLAGAFSAILLVLLLGKFNAFTGKQFSFNEVLSTGNIVLFFGLLVGLGIVSGWYPAIVITRFEPIKTLHGGLNNVSLKSFRFSTRHIMVGIQYVLSVGLILVSLIIQKQYSFLQNTDMGFNKENLMVIPLTSSLRSDLESTKNAFTSYSGIKDVTFSYGVPGGIVAGDGVILPRIKSSEFTSNMFLVADNYLETLDMEIVAGRGFDPNLKTDEQNAFIINEAAVKGFGLGSAEEAIGEPVNWRMWVDGDSIKRGKIIGVVSDFNFKSLRHKIESTVLHIFPDQFQYVLIKLDGSQFKESMEFIEQQYRTFEPERPFQYEFVDQSFQKFYESEEKAGQLFALFTILAIFTASIGLYGLVSYSIVSRSKEISIRKVLGANLAVIYGLLVKSYFKLVIISLIIAVPAAFYISSNWLENFAYRTNVGWEVFALVVVLTFLMTLVTVSLQALKGAFTNPADRLRSE